MSRNSKKPPKGNYRVGYGRPPESSQFKPGQSGNPKGRPRRKESLEDSIFRESNKPYWIVENGKRVRSTLEEIIIKQLIRNAAKGDIKSLRLVLEACNKVRNRRNAIAAAVKTEFSVESLKKLSPIELSELARSMLARSDNPELQEE